MKNLVLAAAACAGIALTADLQAAVVYTGGTYTQSFDSLPNTPANTTLGNSPTGWKDDDAAPPAGNFSIPGWYLWHSVSATEGGFNGRQRMRISTGSSNTGSFYSFGGSGSTERSLGDVGSTTIATNPTVTPPAVPDSRILTGLRLTNTTGTTLTDFTMTFDGEQWRDGGRTGATETMTFQYQVGATAVQDAAGWITPAGTPSTQATPNPVGGSNGSWVSPVQNNSTTAAAVDGNTTGLVDNITVTVSGLNWAPGTDLWLRWFDEQVSGNDHGMSIDNVQFVAVPEPATIGLLAMGAVGLLGRRRSR